MREVLFRGKWTLLNEWLEGDLIQYSDTYQEIRDKKLGRQYPIDPSTGGQFSGLTDKNGKKIFEGDIVRYMNKKTMVVVWNKDSASFAVAYSAINFNYLATISSAHIYLEVIGNIHDNPELLEAKQ